jgi:gas vesicle protein
MSTEMTDAMNADDRITNRIAWFFVGLAIGATAAVLYAPKSGKQTRDLIAQKAEESRQAVESGTHDLLERGREMYDEGRQLVDDATQLFERGRRLVRG